MKFESIKRIRSKIAAWHKRRRVAKRHKKLIAAAKTAAEAGLSCVRIVRRAGTDYIMAQDGSLRRIGRKEK